MLLPAVMFVTLAIAHGRTRAAVVAAVVPAVLVFAHYTLMEVTGRMGLLGVGITVWYATVGVAMLHRAVGCDGTSHRAGTLSGHGRTATIGSGISHSRSQQPFRDRERSCLADLCASAGCGSRSS